MRTRSRINSVSLGAYTCLRVCKTRYTLYMTGTVHSMLQYVSLPPLSPLSLSPPVEYNSRIPKYCIAASEAEFHAGLSKVHTYTNMLYVHCHTFYHTVCTVQMHVVNTYAHYTYIMRYETHSYMYVCMYIYTVKLVRNPYV